MTYRPIYKMLSVFIWFLASGLSFWLCWRSLDSTERYYLGIPSLFLYERLLLPDPPSFPGSSAQPTKTYLVVECTPPLKGYCLAQPGNKEKLYKQALVGNHAAGYALLTQNVFHRGVLAMFLWPLMTSALLLFLLPGLGVWLDSRRETKLWYGVQMDGRRPKNANRFWARRGDDFRIPIEDK